jgi:alkylhydroperoxidase family enzyme
MSSTPRLTDPETGAPLSLTDACPELGQAVQDFFLASLAGARLDIVTRELVRIYSGRLTHCSICRNTRVRAAVDRGLSEDVVAQLDDFEHSDLSERHKAAIRFAHAFLVDPGALGERGRAALLVHFTPEQVAELVLDLVRLRPGSKMVVAGGNEPADDELVFV